jgi:FAD/FMN-containing dehydrogenase
MTDSFRLLSSQAQDTGMPATPLASEEHDHQPRIRDWSDFVSFSPRLYFRPRSIDELKGFVAGAAQGFIRADSIRVLGSLHSCSEICVSDAIVDVSGMPKPIEFSADDSVVTASANWELHEFFAELGKRGKALGALGGTNAQTLAGIMSTATAPATPKRGIYDLLNWVEYVTIDPTTKQAVEKRVTRSDPEFPALVASLGAVGIITRVQFRTIDEPFFKVKMKIIPMAEALGDLDATSAKYDFWRVNWIPDSDEALLWAATQIPAGEADPEGDYDEDEAETVLNFLFMLWDKISSGSAGPLLDKPMQVVYQLLSTFYNLNQVNVTGPLRNMLPVDRRAPLRVSMAEWAFRPDDLDAVLDLCERYFEEQGWPNIPTEIELTKTDDYFMSPWNWDGLDYIVKFNFMYLTEICKTEEEKAMIGTHLKGLWDRLIQEGIPFKPHWGKLNFMDPQFVAENFHLTEFSPLIRPLFLNDYVASRLRP